jgi:hypothetical protein
MYRIIFNTSNILVHSSVIDAFVNVIADALTREATSEIVAFPLIDFLVVTVSRSMSTTFAAGVPTTVVMMGLSVAVVVVVLLSKGTRRVIVVMSAGSR